MKVDKGGRWTAANIYTHQIDASRRIPSGHVSGPKSTFSVSGMLSIKFYLLENILNSFPEINVSHLCNMVLVSIQVAPLARFCPDVKTRLVTLSLVMTST